MKIIKWIILLWTVLLVGCAQPNFDAEDKYIMYANGKAYAIPFGVNYNAHIPKASYSMMREAGITCSNNGMTWHEKRFSSKMGKSRNINELIQYMKYGYQHKLFGCSEPLTKKEYHYYLKKQSKTATHYCPKCSSI